jgi:uncharacterized pyridoxamine 5'-phosphate oxidase family protein
MYSNLLSFVCFVCLRPGSCVFSVASGTVGTNKPVIIPFINVSVIGYYIYRGSNNDKTLYRQNPNDVKFKGKCLWEDN